MIVSLYTVDGKDERICYAWVNGSEAIDNRGRWWVALGKAWIKGKIKAKTKVKYLRTGQGVLRDVTINRN